MTYQHAAQYVDRIVAVDEGLICQTILDLYSKQAVVAEPAGALSVAALELIKEEIKGKTVVCIISGGNNDSTRMAEIEEKSLIYQGLKHYFVVNFPQRPGALKEFVSNILGPTDDITRFEYTKNQSRNRTSTVRDSAKRQEDLPHYWRECQDLIHNILICGTINLSILFLFDFMNQALQKQTTF